MEKPKIKREQIIWIAGIILILTTLFIEGLLIFLKVPIFDNFFPLFARIMIGFMIALPALAGIGIILGFVWLPKHLVKRNEWLKQNGIKTKAKLFSIEINFRIQIQIRHPYYIQAKGINPVTNKKQMFRSENIWFNPQNKVPKELTVLVHPNGKHYYMPLNFLDQ